MATCETNDLLYAARCFGGLTAFQLQLINAALLCQILSDSPTPVTCDAQELLNAAGCFSCLTPMQLQIIQTQLLCEILNGGGTGGGACLECGTVNPTVAATSDCCIYYRRDTGAFWFWDSVGATWIMFIGP